jgi:F-type H+-transporting ATPase subunit delta
MATDDRTRGYAQALFSVAEAEGALEEVEAQLFGFSRALEQQSELREALTDIHLPAGRKRAVLDELLEGRAHPQTVSLLSFIVEQGRARDLSGIVDEMVRMAAERRQQAVAEVRTAVPLDEDRQRRLAEALSHVSGKQVELRVVLDGSIIGGVVARVGDQVYDGSVRRKLELARERLREV